MNAFTNTLNVRQIRGFRARRNALGNLRARHPVRRHGGHDRHQPDLSQRSTGNRENAGGVSFSRSARLDGRREIEAKRRPNRLRAFQLLKAKKKKKKKKKEKKKKKKDFTYGLNTNNTSNGTVFCLGRAARAHREKSSSYYFIVNCYLYCYLLLLLSRVTKKNAILSRV